jgi:mono/diheme cytochrome c family protein
MDDPHWTVRRQLAASIGELPPAARLEPAIAMLQRYGSDPITVDAVVSGLSGMEAQVLGRLLQDEGNAEAAEAVAMLTGALARSRPPTAVPSLLDQAATVSRPLWQRTALLRGLDAGLGSSDRDNPAGARRSAPASAAVRIPALPPSLPRMESEPGDIETLAKAVAARLDWPGKPETRSEAPPLTAVEQARFEAGQKPYGNLCLACHGADGRGRERQAPSLVGSPLLVGDAGVPARIVLAGKEGEIGLMPPLAALSDDEIASVLTYARRAWGNSASAVEPDVVKEIRGLTKLRTRPWTAEELRALPR